MLILWITCGIFLKGLLMEVKLSLSVLTIYSLDFENINYNKKIKTTFQMLTINLLKIRTKGKCR